MSQFFLDDGGTPGVPGIESITGNNAVPVFADPSHNINIIGSGNITVTGVAITNTLTVSENQAQVSTNYTSVNFAMSPYTVTSTDYYISVDSSGGSVTIRLPNTTTTYRLFVVKDRTGNVNTNPITVTTVGGVVLIDGATTYVFNQAYESADILFNSTSYEVF